MGARIYFVAAAAAALMAGPAPASTGNHDKQDSVYSWGRWAVLSPAAGRPQVALLKLGGPDVPRNCATDPASCERPEPQPPQEVEGPCAAGQACGFATYHASSATDGPSYGPPQTEGRVQPAALAVRPTTNGPVPADFRADSGGLAAAAQGAAVGRTGFAVSATNPADQAPDVKSLDMALRNAGARAFSGDGTDTQFSPSTGPATPAVRVDHDSRVSGGLPYAGVSQIVAGVWSDSQRRYVLQQAFANAQDLLEFYDSRQVTDAHGVFVAGTTTPQTDLDALKAGQVTASYGGAMLENGTPVSIAVHFGAGTWNGSWGGSKGSLDLSKATVVTRGNGAYLQGQVGFTASGVVSGANIVSKQLSSGLTGSVKGSFFGAGAQTLGGSVDVHANVDGTDARQVDVFAAGRGAVLGSGRSPVAQR